MRETKKRVLPGLKPEDMPLTKSEQQQYAQQYGMGAYQRWKMRSEEKGIRKQARKKLIERRSYAGMGIPAGMDYDNFKALPKKERKSVMEKEFAKIDSLTAEQKQQAKIDLNMGWNKHRQLEKAEKKIRVKRKDAYLHQRENFARGIPLDMTKFEFSRLTEEGKERKRSAMVKQQRSAMLSPKGRSLSPQQMKDKMKDLGMGRNKSKRLRNAEEKIFRADRLAVRNEAKKSKNAHKNAVKEFKKLKKDYDAAVKSGLSTPEELTKMKGELQGKRAEITKIQSHAKQNNLKALSKEQQNARCKQFCKGPRGKDRIRFREWRTRRAMTKLTKSINKFERDMFKADRKERKQAIKADRKAEKQKFSANKTDVKKTVERVAGKDKKSANKKESAPEKPAKSVSIDSKRGGPSKPNKPSAPSLRAVNPAPGPSALKSALKKPLANTGEGKKKRVTIAGGGTSRPDISISGSRHPKPPPGQPSLPITPRAAARQKTDGQHVSSFATSKPKPTNLAMHGAAVNGAFEHMAKSGQVPMALRGADQQPSSHAKYNPSQGAR